MNKITLDESTAKLLAFLQGEGEAPPEVVDRVRVLYEHTQTLDSISPIVELFILLKAAKKKYGAGLQAFHITPAQAVDLCIKHRETDEHKVSVGERADWSLEKIQQAESRVAGYVKNEDSRAVSGLDMAENIVENQKRIQKVLGMHEEEWDSYVGQLDHMITNLETLGKCIELPATTMEEALRIDRRCAVSITPYYASLITARRLDDPVLLQVVPVGGVCLEDRGKRLFPVPSPARLTEQVYSRVAVLKMPVAARSRPVYCPDVPPEGPCEELNRQAVGEALNYIAKNKYIRDVTIAGGDSLTLTNKDLHWLLSRLGEIEHVKTRRLTTKVPVTIPQRVDEELLKVLATANKKKPLRVLVEINAAREISELSSQILQSISQQVVGVFGQIILLKGINDTRLKMWRLCEAMQEAFVTPYMVYNCCGDKKMDYLQVPLDRGRAIIESMYGNLADDAVPRYVVEAQGAVPVATDNVIDRNGQGRLLLRKPWNGEIIIYPDAVYDGGSSKTTDFTFS